MNRARSLPFTAVVTLVTLVALIACQAREAPSARRAQQARHDSADAAPAALVDAVRARLHSTSDFEVDHARAANGWAFLRATEVVRVDSAETQETDLTVAALLRRTGGAWQVVELWTLPTDESLPAAEFRRRVGVHQARERLPDAMFPDDMRPTPPPDR
jgi:hypothetical protein